MTSEKNWLYERLRAEPIREDERERWESILSRLCPATSRDLSGMKAGATYPDEWRQKRRKERSCREGERELVGLAAALIGKTVCLSDAEAKLVAQSGTTDWIRREDVRAKIAAGEDVLGAEYCLLRSAEDRRQIGATYTPAPIVDAMADWACAEKAAPARVVDPGTGSGRFLVAAARRFPDAQLIGIDVDPLAALMLRANAAVHGFSHRLTVHLGDYRSVNLPPIDGTTLFIGNPPYVRHHEIGGQWKAWFAATARRYGLTASKLAGLHIHFFLKTRELARPGDYGAFITAAEWLDVNYGSVLRRMLADGLGGTAVHIIDPKAQPFADALTTGAITCFRVGNRSASIVLSSVASLGELAPLGRGRTFIWADVEQAHKWSELVNEPRRRSAGSIELGELFRVHRGQVTGANDVWIDNDAAWDIPKRYKRFAVTSARELIATGTELISTSGLRRVIDLPPDLESLDPDERRAIQRFLVWARNRGAHESYIARHRRSWWSVGLRAPAPILCTYMARRAPAFVLNSVRAHHINIAHGLYPRERMTDKELALVLAYLRRHASTAGGRTYAGGLVKFEPKELERILIPRLEDLHGYLAEFAKAPQALERAPT